MPKKKNRLLTLDRIVRMIADVIMLDIAIFLGELIAKISLNPTGLVLGELFLKVHNHVLGIVFLDIVALIVFFVSGFYTRSRGYQSKFKALVVFQAVCVTYLLFAFGNYLAHDDFISPTALIVAWILSLAFLIVSRLWSIIWRRLILKEIGHTHPVPSTSTHEILVIGGAGYIGSALLPLLIAKGYTVRILDLFIYGEEPIQEYLNHPKVKIYRADFRQIDKVVEAVKGVDQVVHLGALVGDPACALDETLTIEINLMATRMIAEVCKGFGVNKFIFASTCSVYGASDEVLNEHSKLNPVSLYARSKIACEKILLDMANSEFTPVILRFSTIFGLSGRTRFDLVVNLLTAKAHFEKKITVMGGDQWRPFLHVEDAARSIVSALTSTNKAVKSQIFNVGGNHLNYTLMQAGELIAAKISDAELIDLGNNQDRRNYRVDFTKIHKMLRYRTKWTLEEGIDQVLRSLLSGKIKDYKEAQYSNEKYLVERGAKESLSAQSITKFHELLNDF
jgi:nucleoside-diphosphate-sugar epimerase